MHLIFLMYLLQTKFEMQQPKKKKKKKKIWRFNFWIKKSVGIFFFQKKKKVVTSCYKWSYKIENKT